MKPRIALFDAHDYDRESLGNALAKSEKFDMELKYFTEHLSLDSLPLTKGFDAICLFVNDPVTSEMVPELVKNGVKLIALRSAGYNNIDLAAVYGKIPVLRVPAYSPNAVAEHAAALILTLNRKTHRAFNRTRESNFTISGFKGFDLYGKTAGIIGTGKIGQIMCGILRGFGMKVVAFDAFPNKEAAARIGYDYVELDTLFKTSDIISLHCPLTPATERLINSDSIGAMKKGVMIINTSRGKLIDSKALIEGLKVNQVGYAGLDVYEEEGDYFFEDFSSSGLDDDTLARLLTFPNVLITSHQAFFTEEALANIANTTLSNIHEFFASGARNNEVCYRCGQNPTICTKIKTGKCF